MQIKELIRKKRNGTEHDEGELKELVNGYLQGRVKDYQMAAWLMAVYFRGLSKNETKELTQLMWSSGENFPRAVRTGYWVDKHSTGGQGDKTSLILIPLVTAVSRRLFGSNHVKIPMVSGRGLGRTGGTLDKLESVPGFNSQLTTAEASRLLSMNGYVMMAQTENLVPLDRLLYQLRDATATVDSVPLIVCSILSKKLAENLDGIVFDVKLGNGAHLPNEEEGRSLAQGLVEAAKSGGLDAVAVFTRMSEPLGYKVGNHLEVEECADFLEGKRCEEGLREVTLTLASWMIHLSSRRQISLSDAKTECEEELERGTLSKLLQEMFRNQGGDWSEFEENRRRLRDVLLRFVVHSPMKGFLSEVNASLIGWLVNELGGGRSGKEDVIDPLVGLEFMKKVGDAVEIGEPIVTVYHRKSSHQEVIRRTLDLAIRVDRHAVPRSPWVVGQV